MRRFLTAKDAKVYAKDTKGFYHKRHIRKTKGTKFYRRCADLFLTAKFAKVYARGAKVFATKEIKKNKSNNRRCVDFLLICESAVIFFKTFDFRLSTFFSLSSLRLLSFRLFYNFPFLISSTISGFNKVVISPKLEKSPSAILRNILRIIFPDRVFGNPDTN
ncbi:hypothetical protein MCEGE10_00450 [Flavobacteriaceae bacterium]